MATPVIKVAAPDYDIRTADPKDLRIDSTKNQFKVALEGSGTFSFSARGVGNTAQRLSADLTHNLGYQPSFFAQLKGPSGVWEVNPVKNDMCTLTSTCTGPTMWFSGVARLDKNTIRLYCYILDPTLPAYSAFTVDYEYLIFTDPNKNVWS